LENTFQTLGLEQYNILIGSFEESLKHTLETTQFSRLIVITDETVFAKIYKPRAILFPKNTLVIQVRAGEQYKILDTCKIIWEELLRNNIDRNALCINLGGGVIVILAAGLLAIWVGFALLHINAAFDSFKRRQRY